MRDEDQDGNLPEITFSPMFGEIEGNELAQNQGKRGRNMFQGLSISEILDETPIKAKKRMPLTERTRNT